MAKLILWASAAALLLAACGTTPETVNSSAAATLVENDAADVGNSTSAPAAAEPAPEATTTTLGSFWQAFRAAALAGDKAALVTLSAPTVRQHGELDDDPAIRLAATDVAPALARLLEDVSPIDESGRSLRATLQSAEAPPREEGQPAGRRRVGPLVFVQGAGGWRLTEIYGGSDA